MKLIFGRLYVSDEQWIPVKALLLEILKTSDDMSNSDVLIISKESSREIIEKAFGGK